MTFGNGARESRNGNGKQILLMLQKSELTQLIETCIKFETEQSEKK